MPVVFILLLPVAFAASVKNDSADNAFAFSFDAENTDVVSATSSTRYDFDDDVSLFVNVVESTGSTPLLGKARFELLDDEAVQYDGTVTFLVENMAGVTAYEASKSVNFTLRPKRGKKVKVVKFPFSVPSGDYSVELDFSR